MFTKIKNFFYDLRNWQDKAITILFWLTFVVVAISFSIINFVEIKELLHYPEEKYVLLEEEAEKLLQTPNLIESLVSGAATDYSYDLKFSFDKSYSNVELKLKDGTADLTVQIVDFENRETVIKRNFANPLLYVLLTIISIVLVMLVFTVVFLMLVVLSVLSIFSLMAWRRKKTNNLSH